MHAVLRPTRITPLSASLTDNIFVNFYSGNQELFVLVNDLSDHLPIMLCTDLQPWTYPNPPLTSRRLVNVNNSALSQFQGSLNNADWSDVMREVCKNNDPSTAH